LQGAGLVFIVVTVLDSDELLKLIALTLLFGVAAPFLGVFLRFFPSWQKWVFGLMCFMTMGGLLEPLEWGLTLDFNEYRGHAQGYPFYVVEALALALILGKAFENWNATRLVPPGLWLWFLYCGLALLSIMNAVAPDLALKAAFKTVKIAVVLVAAYNFIRSEKDLHFFLATMSVAVIWQLLLVLKLKYRDGIYQVAGTFEHQNSLSMYINMIAMVLLAAALGPKHRFSNLYLSAFIACAAIQQSALSRGGLVVFMAATCGVIFFSLAEKVNRRRIAVTLAIGLVGLAGLAKGWNTIIERFQEHANEAGTITRQKLKQASMFMVDDYPLGIGWNNYGIAINPPFPYGDHIDKWELEGGVRPDPNHQKGIEESLFFLILAETGYQGLAAFALFILVFLWRNLKGMWVFRHTLLASVSLGIAMGCANNYAHSLLERVLTQPRNLMLWMLLLGITARIESWQREKRRKEGAELTATARPVRKEQLVPVAQSSIWSRPSQAGNPARLKQLR
jgi:hypothetical protein